MLLINQRPAYAGHCKEIMYTNDHQQPKGNIMEHQYTVTLYPHGNAAAVGIVQLSPATNYGYWEFKDGSEGGGLWFENNELVDFDGHYLLPAKVVTALRDHGCIVDDTFN